jgi:hypothetical protein
VKTLLWLFHLGMMHRNISIMMDRCSQTLPHYRIGEQDLSDHGHLGFRGPETFQGMGRRPTESISIEDPLADQWRQATVMSGRAFCGDLPQSPTVGVQESPGKTAWDFAQGYRGRTGARNGKNRVQIGDADRDVGFDNFRTCPSKHCFKSIIDGSFLLEKSTATSSRLE